MPAQRQLRHRLPWSPSNPFFPVFPFCVLRPFRTPLPSQSLFLKCRRPATKVQVKTKETCALYHCLVLPKYFEKSQLRSHLPFLHLICSMILPSHPCSNLRGECHSHFTDGQLGPWKSVGWVAWIEHLRDQAEEFSEGKQC